MRNGLKIQWGTKIYPAHSSTTIQYVELTSADGLLAITNLDQIKLFCTETPLGSAVNHCCEWDKGRSTVSKLVVCSTNGAGDLHWFLIGF